MRRSRAAIAALAIALFAIALFRTAASAQDATDPSASDSVEGVEAPGETAPVDPGPGPGATSDSASGSTGTASTGSTGTGSTGAASTGTGSTGTASTGTASTGTASTGTASTGSAGTPSTRGAGTMSAGQPGATPYTITVNRGRRDEEEEEEEEDQGDPYDILWIELFGGVSYVDLRAISTTNYFPMFVRLQGTGPAGGAAIGFRLQFFSAGVRVAVAHYDQSGTRAPDGTTFDGSFDVGTAVGEITLAIPIPIVKPYVRAGFGFGWHGNANLGDSGLTVPMDVQTTVFGWVFSGTVGLDIYLVEWFAIGAAFAVDILNMSRQAWSEPAGSPTDVSFENPGDAVGFQGRGQASISFHF